MKFKKGQVVRCTFTNYDYEVLVTQDALHEHSFAGTIIKGDYAKHWIN